MGCRSFLSPWKDENGEYKWEGRFNQGVVSINLPQIGILAKGNEEKFWKLLDERLELCYEALMCRHKALEGVVFSGTVRENIRYGRLDASDEEIEEAARNVSADMVVAKMEKGYDSDVGESGGLLSTGEKQLISFARAVLANPAIFVLDEATSSIDTQTEKLIQDATNHLLKGHTSFVIAHRLSTIRQADLILVVKDGKIIERGSSVFCAAGYHLRTVSRQ